MKLCEYLNNLLSSSALTQIGGEIGGEFITDAAIYKHDVAVFSNRLGINFTLSVEKTRSSPLSSLKIRDVEFANKMIRKYGIIPMGIIIFVGYAPGEIVLREIIRANDPDEIRLYFRD
jgi:hypothetical protein